MQMEKNVKRIDETITSLERCLSPDTVNNMENKCRRIVAEAKESMDDVIKKNGIHLLHKVEMVERKCNEACGLVSTEVDALSKKKKK